jgi:hypothetical protein
MVCTNSRADTGLLDLHQTCGLNEAAEQLLGRG